jgi:hypothetical protein
MRGIHHSIIVLQLMGVSVPGLEPELQPVVDHFLPQIIARIKEPHDIQLQVFCRLAFFVVAASECVY